MFVFYELYADHVICGPSAKRSPLVANICLPYQPTLLRSPLKWPSVPFPLLFSSVWCVLIGASAGNNRSHYGKFTRILYLIDQDYIVDFKQRSSTWCYVYICRIYAPVICTTGIYFAAGRKRRTEDQRLPFADTYKWPCRRCSYQRWDKIKGGWKFWII